MSVLRKPVSFSSSIDMDVKVNHGPITVTENRAPTDESIKILNEMQEKALKNIISKLKIDDNIFNCHAMIHSNMEYDEYEIYIKYSYNKHERVVKHSIDDSFMKELNGLQKVVDGLKLAIAKDFAEVITNSVLFDIGNTLLNVKYK